MLPREADACPCPVNRRLLLRGAAVTGVAVPLLAACGSTDSPTGSADPPSADGALVATAEVPVGGGVVLTEQQVVVTQPTEGEFKAFSAVCTHQGCAVSGVEDGMIVCNCHGSTFSAVDGAPTGGPAPSPLDEIAVTVQGDRIVAS